jgi:hypothetical protein
MQELEQEKVMSLRLFPGIKVRMISIYFGINSILYTTMSFHQFLQKNLYIRYVLLAGTIFMAIYMIQAITQNTSMDSNIIELDKKIEKTRRETIFLEQIYKPYLESELSYFVLMHEQSLLLPGEKIIRLDDKSRVVKPTDTKKEEAIMIPLPSLAPPDARRIFFQQIKEKNFPSTPTPKA